MSEIHEIPSCPDPINKKSNSFALLQYKYQLIIEINIKKNMYQVSLFLEI